MKEIILELIGIREEILDASVEVVINLFGFELIIRVQHLDNGSILILDPSLKEYAHSS
jgi:hypothetical protein